MAYYLKNSEHNGIEIYFGTKPSSDIIAELKANHWRWHPSKSCWYNRYTEANEALAKAFCGEKSVSTPAKRTSTRETPSVKRETVTPPPKHVAPKTAPAVPSVKSNKYASSALRKDSSEIERNLTLEKQFGIKDISLYYYSDNGGDIRIVGEVFATTPLKKAFCFICTLYDEDDDIIETKQNLSYGSGVVTSMIKPSSFFDGYPFSFLFFKPKATVKRITLIPAERY